MKIIWVAGARPNFVKIAPIWRAMEAFNATRGAGEPCFEPVLVHTGQHYDKNMSDVFFQDLALPRPDVFLGVGGGTHAEQTGRILVGFEKVLREIRPSMVGVVGDVNSTCACALATAKSYVCPGGRNPVLIHVEAGLRSRDRLMPEEINRVVTDGLADLLFTSEPSGTANLLAEGIPEDRVHFVGNVMVDSLFRVRDEHIENGFAGRLDWSEGTGGCRSFGLVTLHRPSNVDDDEMLGRIVSVLSEIGARVPVLFPVHPRTRARLSELGHVNQDDSAPDVLRPTGLQFLPPLGYGDFLDLMMKATFVITDSGGIQEETTALGIPCLTLRENTERPATVEQGTNILLGGDTARLIVEVDSILDGRSKRGVVPDLWDGRASERVVSVLSSYLPEIK